MATETFGKAGSTTYRTPSDREIVATRVYREVTPPERLVFTESWGGDWPEALNTLVLTEEEAGR